MIRRTLQPDGTILVESALKVELHGPDGTIIEGRAPIEPEASSLSAWAEGRTPGRAQRLTRTQAQMDAERSARLAELERRREGREQPQGRER